MMGRKVRLKKDEDGYALLLVLILLILVGLIIGPFLLLMTTSLMSSQRHEEWMHGFYAADAGIETGVYKILHTDPNLPDVGATYTYILEDEGGQALEINGSTVEVELYGEQEETYRITATSTDNSDGKSTTIESYASLPADASFLGLFDNAITSNGDVTIQPGTEIDGDVQYGGELDNRGEIDGEITQATEDWPTAEQLSAFYWEDVKDLEPFASNTIDLKTYDDDIGPLYRNGSLTIKSTASDPRTATLGGTVYVTGDVTIGQSGKDFTMELNGQTIYAEGNIALQPKCTISGSGAIIAVAEGDVDFQPNLLSGEDDFIFILSVEGTVTMKPGGSFYGAMAGIVEVEIQPNCTLEWRSLAEGEELNFLTEIIGELEIHTYTIE